MCISDSIIIIFISTIDFCYNTHHIADWFHILQYIWVPLPQTHWQILVDIFGYNILNRYSWLINLWLTNKMLSNHICDKLIHLFSFLFIWAVLRKDFGECFGNFSRHSRWFVLLSCCCNWIWNIVLMEKEGMFQNQGRAYRYQWLKWINIIQNPPMLALMACFHALNGSWICKII